MLIDDAISTIAENVVAVGSLESNIGNFFKSTMDRLEREVLIELLALHGGNQCAVARVIGLHRNTLDRRLRKFNVPYKYGRKPRRG